MDSEPFKTVRVVCWKAKVSKMTDSTTTTTTTNMTNVSLPFPPSQPLLTRHITCGGHNQWCGHPGCPDLTIKPSLTREFCGSTEKYCGHPGCADRTQDYTGRPLQPVVTCGGTLTYCGHPGCPDRTIKPDDKLISAVEYGDTGITHIYAYAREYKFDKEKQDEYFRNNPDTGEARPLEATISCGGSSLYCGHPWCTDMTPKLVSTIRPRQPTEPAGPRPLAPTPAVGFR